MKPARKTVTSASAVTLRRRAMGFLALLLVLAAVCNAVLRFCLGLGNPILIAPDPACAYILKPDQNVFRFFGHTRINHYGMRSDDIYFNARVLLLVAQATEPQWVALAKR